MANVVDLENFKRVPQFHEQSVGPILILRQLLPTANQKILEEITRNPALNGQIVRITQYENNEVALWGKTEVFRFTQPDKSVDMSSHPREVYWDDASKRTVDIQLDVGQVPQGFTLDQYWRDPVTYPLSDQVEILSVQADPNIAPRERERERERVKPAVKPALF